MSVLHGSAAQISSAGQSATVFYSFSVFFVAFLTSPDMSKHTTSTEAKTTRSYAMCLRNDQKAAGAAVDVGGTHEITHGV